MSPLFNLCIMSVSHKDKPGARRRCYIPPFPMQMVHAHVAAPVRLQVSMCWGGGVLFESIRFGPRGGDEAIKPCVSHINCFDLLPPPPSFSGSRLEGSRGHFTQLERVFRSAKTRGKGKAGTQK